MVVPLRRSMTLALRSFPRIDEGKFLELLKDNVLRRTLPLVRMLLAEHAALQIDRLMDRRFVLITFFLAAKHHAQAAH